VRLARAARRRLPGFLVFHPPVAGLPASTIGMAVLFFALDLSKIVINNYIQSRFVQNSH